MIMVQPTPCVSDGGPNGPAASRRDTEGIALPYGYRSWGSLTPNGAQAYYSTLCDPCTPCTLCNLDVAEPSGFKVAV